MKPTLYTLISYIPGEEGWHDRCGDYHRGQDSELSIRYFTDKESAGEFYGQTKFQNDDAEITILINGMNPDEYHDFITEEEQQNLSFEEEEIRDLGYKKYNDLKEAKRLQDEAAKLKKQQEEELKRQKEKDRLEQSERAQLAQLMAKYGQK